MCGLDLILPTVATSAYTNGTLVMIIRHWGIAIDYMTHILLVPF
jgi:hypothetical protein